MTGWGCVRIWQGHDSALFQQKSLRNEKLPGHTHTWRSCFSLLGCRASVSAKLKTQLSGITSVRITNACRALHLPASFGSLGWSRQPLIIIVISKFCNKRARATSILCCTGRSRRTYHRHPCLSRYCDKCLQGCRSLAYRLCPLVCLPVVAVSAQMGRLQHTHWR